jgi:solute carrier family 35 protein F5
LIALLGSLFYGFYITFLKLKVDDELVDPQLFLGFVGLSNLIILIPIFPIVHYTGFEIFSFPPNGTIWGILFIGALLGTVL